MIRRQKVGDVELTTGTVWDEAIAMSAALARIESNNENVDCRLTVKENDETFDVLYRETLIVAHFPYTDENYDEEKERAEILLCNLNTVLQEEQGLALWLFADKLETLARGGYENE